MLKNHLNPYFSYFLSSLFCCFFGIQLFAAEYKIEITQTEWELKPGLITTAWTYNNMVPGTPIIVRPGERVQISVTNHLNEATNIHWHGLVLPNDQDGPFLSIKPGKSFNYDFIAGESGTYWYHPHEMPVLPQLDRGLYAPFIILAPEDEKYSGDHTYILDDWLLDTNGNRIEGNPAGSMERYGTIETVNGKTGGAVKPLALTAGELHKLRFINASTAAVHTIHITDHRFRVTHTDGHPLMQPYFTDVLVIAPGERFDVELFASGKEGSTSEISSSRRDLGIVIPIIYGKERVSRVASPFIPSSSKAYFLDAPKKPNLILELGSDMGMGMMGGMMGSDSGILRWTINGKAFPETQPIKVSLSKVTTMRIYNNDHMSMMMGHRMDHPIHLHGTKFQVLSINGNPPSGEVWKDTIPVPSGGYVDIAFVMTNPGDWLLHCHIIDHEDGGMMTLIRVK